MSIENMIGLVVVVLTAGFLVIFALYDRKRRLQFRQIRALEKMDRAIGLSVENGTRLHVSLGRGEFLGMPAASILTNMAVLEEIARRTSGSDHPPSATSGSGVTTLLAVDILQSSRQSGFSRERMDSRRGRLAGTTPLTYAAGVLPTIYNEQTSSILLTGTMGAEIRLILDAAEDEELQILAAPDSLIGQAVAFSSSVDLLIGEEIFAIPAYLHAGSMYTASLLAQDSLRWIVIIFMIIGAALRSIGLQIP
jgi:hypothetical protein